MRSIEKQAEKPQKKKKVRQTILEPNNELVIHRQKDGRNKNDTDENARTR